MTTESCYTLTRFYHKSKYYNLHNLNKNSPHYDTCSTAGEVLKRLTYFTRSDIFNYFSHKTNILTTNYVSSHFKYY